MKVTNKELAVFENVADKIFQVKVICSLAEKSNYQLSINESVAITALLKKIAEDAYSSLIENIGIMETTE